MTHPKVRQSETSFRLFISPLLTLPCHIQSHLQVLMVVNAGTAQIQCLHPILLPSLSCKSLGISFLFLGWEHTESFWFNCSFYRWASEHHRLLPQGQSSQQNSSQTPLLSITTSFEPLFILVRTTYTKLVIPKQDKYLISMYLYFSQTSKVPLVNH